MWYLHFGGKSKLNWKRFVHVLGKKLQTHLVTLAIHFVHMGTMYICRNNLKSCELPFQSPLDSNSTTVEYTQLSRVWTDKEKMYKENGKNIPQIYYTISIHEIMQHIECLEEIGFGFSWKLHIVIVFWHVE